MSPEQARGRRSTSARTSGRSAACCLRCSREARVRGRDDLSTTLARVLERDVNLTALPASVPPRVRHADRDVPAEGHAPATARDGRRAAGARRRLRDETTRRTQSCGAPAPAVAARASDSCGRLPLRRPLSAFVAEIEPLPKCRNGFQVPAPQGSATPARRLPAISPDGRMLAYTVDRRRWRHAYILFARSILETRC